MRSIDVRPDDSILLEYNERLQAIDPRLLMVRAKETGVVPGVPMRPGFYHLLRDNSDRGAPMTVMVIEDDGRYTEPTSRVFEKLAAGDMTQRRNLDRFKTHERQEHEANEAEQKAVREERREHLKELVNAYTRTSISTTDAVPWRQNNAGHRRGGG